MTTFDINRRCWFDLSGPLLFTFLLTCRFNRYRILHITTVGWPGLSLEPNTVGWPGLSLEPNTVGWPGLSLEPNTVGWPGLSLEPNTVGWPGLSLEPNTVGWPGLSLEPNTVGWPGLSLEPNFSWLGLSQVPLFKVLTVAFWSVDGVCFLRFRFELLTSVPLMGFAFLESRFGWTVDFCSVDRVCFSRS